MNVGEMTLGSNTPPQKQERLPLRLGGQVREEQRAGIALRSLRLESWVEKRS